MSKKNNKNKASKQKAKNYTIEDLMSKFNTGPNRDRNKKKRD